jgi:hypothetical protein
MHTNPLDASVVKGMGGVIPPVPAGPSKEVNAKEKKNRKSKSSMQHSQRRVQSSTDSFDRFMFS